MSSENKNGKVPLISKIAYGFGDVGCNFSWMFVSNFLMIFYTDDIEARPAVADCSLAPAAAEAGYTAVAHSAVDRKSTKAP